MEISNVKEQNSSWLAAFSKRPIFFMSRKEMAACFDANRVLRKSRLKNVEMAKDGCTGSMFTCVQAIKNLMKNYNSRGEWVEPTTGLTGLLVTDEMGDSYKRMIDIPESSKEKMFEYVKNNYIEKNGMADGAGKTEIYMDMYKKMDKDDRLSAGWTLGEYRKAYSQAFVSAIKEVDSAWTYGKAIPSGVLEGITRELVEVNLKKPDSSHARASLNIQI